MQTKNTIWRDRERCGITFLRELLIFSFTMKTSFDFLSSPMEFYCQICLCEIGFDLVQLFYYFLVNMVGFYGF
jgi:hypothetical protein